MGRTARQYAVVRVNSDEVLYVGGSIGKVARLLVPGTVHADGTCIRDAVQDARKLAERTRKKMRLPRPEWVDKHREPRRSPGDPSQNEIADGTRRIREEGFTDLRYGQQPPWPGKRYLS